MDNKPSYYAIIPSSIRYDKRLTANAKLLYGEITALCNKEGYCWATNSYFAELYEVSVQTISNWISLLKKYDYLRTELIYEENSKEIKQRNIYLLNPDLIPIKENINTGVKENFNRGIKENFKDNNTSINNINSNSSIVEPTLNEIKQYINENNLLYVNADRFFRYYQESNWRTTKGNIFNWRNKLFDWNESSKLKGDKPVNTETIIRRRRKD